jgi:hypothetical protein
MGLDPRRREAGTQEAGQVAYFLVMAFPAILFGAANARLSWDASISN